MTLRTLESRAGYTTCNGAGEAKGDGSLAEEFEQPASVVRGGGAATCLVLHATVVLVDLFQEPVAVSERAEGLHGPCLAASHLQLQHRRRQGVQLRTDAVVEVQVDVIDGLEAVIVGLGLGPGAERRHGVALVALHGFDHSGCRRSTVEST